MKLDLYTEVALTRDLPADGLKTGAVATLIDYVTHPAGGEGDCRCHRADVRR